LVYYRVEFTPHINRNQCKDDGFVNPDSSGLLCHLILTIYEYIKDGLGEII